MKNSIKQNKKKQKCSSTAGKNKELRYTNLIGLKYENTGPDNTQIEQKTHSYTGSVLKIVKEKNNETSNRPPSVIKENKTIYIIKRKIQPSPGVKKGD